MIVKTMNGNSLVVDVDEHETVDGFQKKIVEFTGVTTDVQVLLFGGQQLQAGHTLDTYKIKHLSTVFLVCRLRGGCTNIET